MHVADSLTALSRMAIEALIPGVLIGIAATIAVALILKRMGPLNAATRGVVWVVTLAVLPLLPALYFVGHPQPIPHAPVLSTAVPHPLPTVRRQQPIENHAKAEAYRGSEQRLSIPVKRDVPLTFLIAYAVIASLLLLRLAIGYLRICGIRRRTYPAPPDVAAQLDQWRRRCPTARRVALRLSDTVRSPMAIGFTRPTIVIPSALVLELSEAEFDDLGVHELAHVRRYDDWTNLFQRVVKALLFFHPAVYWLSRQIDFEREVACDDWAAAAQGPKSYAQCLTKVVELRGRHRGALLASGAFSGKRQVLRRVELLLDKTRNAATRVSAFTVVAITIALLGATLQVAKLPAVVALTSDEGVFHSKSRWKDGDHDVRVDMRGEVTFAAGERSIASLSPWGYFEIEEAKGWTRRRLEVRPASAGGLEEKYFVNDREKPLDESARAWAGTMYPFLMRELAMDVDKRVQRILARGGVSSLLSEVNLIHSDRSKRLYLTQAAEHAGLNPEEMRLVALAARKIASDYEKAEFLLAETHRYATDRLRGAFFRATDSIRSDSDRRRVLMAMLDADGHSPETAELIGKSARSMNSDNDKAEVLLSISRESSENGCTVLKAAGTIQSDGDKARVLRNAGSLQSAPCRQEFFALVDTVQSENDRAGVLRELLGRTGLDAGSYEGVAAAAQRLNSDSDKANLLLALSRDYLAAPFFDALNTVRSDNDRKQVLKAVMERSPEKAVLLRCVESAMGIASENDRAELLMAAAKTSSDTDVRAAVQRACSKLSSDSDYRRVASVLLKGE